MRDKKRVTDYHCHILPGIDDGAETLESALLMARLFHKAGYREIYCTSHLIKGRYEASSSEILDARNQLQSELDREQINIKLLLGREHYIDEFLLDNLRQPLLLEDTNLFLIEIPPFIAVELVKEILFQVTCRGYVPLIAHPERSNLLELPTPEKDNTKFWNFWSNQKSPIKNAPQSSNLSPGYRLPVPSQPRQFPWLVWQKYSKQSQKLRTSLHLHPSRHRCPQPRPS